MVKTYLFDASSIVNLVKKGFVRVFLDGATLDLALYESLNAVWKEYVLLSKLDEKTAIEYIETLTTIFDALDLLSIKGLGLEIFKLALKEQLTIYDASYLYMAIKNKMVLVTDDQKLRDKASKYVKVLDSRQIINSHTKL